MPLKYQHTQKPGVPFYAALAVPVVVAIAFMTNELPPWPLLIIICCGVLYLILMMSSLTVTMDEQFLRVKFGSGVFIKKFVVSEITGIGPKFTTYIWGWGIRWYFVGWLYNIAGFQSVEVIFKSGKKVRIGTDEPEKLAEAIQDAISQTPKATV